MVPNHDNEIKILFTSFGAPVSCNLFIKCLFLFFKSSVSYNVVYVVFVGPLLLRYIHKSVLKNKEYCVTSVDESQFKSWFTFIFMNS